MRFCSVFLIIFLALNILAQASNQSAFELQEAQVQALLEMPRYAATIERMNKKHTPCDDSSKPQTVALASFVVNESYVQEEIKDRSFFKVRCDDLKKCDPDLVKTLPDDMKDKRSYWEFYLEEVNDNNVLTLIGIDAPHMDDTGYTHGVKLKVGHTTYNQYRFTGEINSDLYTLSNSTLYDYKTGSVVHGRMENDRVYRPQYFNDVTTYKGGIQIPIGNLKGSTLSYFRAEAGWVSLKSKDDSDNFLRGNNQQESWHKRLNELGYQVYIPQNVDTKMRLERKNGKFEITDSTTDPFLGFYLGAETKIVETSNGGVVKLYGEAGLQESNRYSANTKVSTTMGVSAEKSVPFAPSVSVFASAEHQRDHFNTSKMSYSNPEGNRAVINWKLGVKTKSGFSAGVGQEMADSGNPISNLDFPERYANSDNFRTTTSMFFSYKIPSK